MIVSEASILIARPPEQVFTVVNDHESIAAWMAYSPALVLTSSPPKVVGSTLRYEFTQGGRVGRMDGRVTALESPRRLEMALSDSAFDLTVAFALAPETGGTRVTHAIRIAPRRFLMRLFSPLIRKGNDRQVADNLARLKVVVEGA